MTQHVPLADTRAVATPAATMRTYAAPSTAPGLPLAVWRTELPAGSAGPLHRIDVDHVVVVVQGTLVAEVDGVRSELPAGDGIVLPAGRPRRLAAGPGADVVTLTSALPGSQAQVGDGDPVAVPWAS
ncbi:cupin domain-containing protein [Nocardioides mesophilus]|uniref:Cupin domain-containing protein n=1 Tax=Nocardioides mesophilus TaxID=433659 RepID=A0A7G9R7B2_9ACTN|nr:cupin domain-containing protein [Nocardioides mesophilus]QNN51487.1 cupin domain-containing protein [Nocardioides mesophilus]